MTADKVVRRGSEVGNAKLTEDDVRKICELVASGLTCTEVAARFGVSRDNVGLISRGKAWRHVSAPRVATLPRVKLSESNVAEIKGRLLLGERVTDLAREFSVGLPTISGIKNGIRWQHVAPVNRGEDRLAESMEELRSRRSWDNLTASTIKLIARRFWLRVNKSGPVVREDLGPCWIWTGACQADGRGMIWLANQYRLAPRVAWLLEHGRWPEHGALHHCDNPPCVRLSHLFDGTTADNSADMVNKGRSARGDRCPRSKIRETDAATICGLLASGMRAVDVARQLNLQPAIVYNISLGYTWRHVPAPRTPDGRIAIRTDEQRGQP